MSENQKIDKTLATPGAAAGSLSGAAGASAASPASVASLAAAPEAKSAARTPNFMASRRVLPDLVEAAIARGVRVTLTKAGYEVEGFYRAGPMRLEPDAKTGGLVAIDRKDTMVAVSTFDELVRLNYECWKRSRDKGAAYINPGREWVDEFARLNLVKRQVIFVPGED